MHSAISEVINRCDKEQLLTLVEVDQLAASMNLSREQFYEAVLMAVAEAFHRESLAFDTGDAVANMLWSLSEFSLDGRAYKVFLAFDEGEYDHRGDPIGSDPVQLYTRPQIKAILQEGTVI
jgi:hypothetical protein